MSGSLVSKSQWVEMFQAIGLEQSAMQRWHQEFEHRHPEGHAAFLRWLGLPDNEVEAIRRQARC